ncbi:acetyl-coenzyme A synthetase N-terminal domain-containing protein, partial [Microbacterium sp. 13-71-7]|uniref:acetyl-coenzyme A synthetase N-terminal domain-containing protein n=1 Tax=Microbacterium sp. 13-71-7 TaxID=1970399 RepID=UPI000BD844BC
MSSQIDHVFDETRVFPPSPEFAAAAVAQPEIYTEAATDREAFWAKQARELHWHTPFTGVLDWSTPPF